ncbi:MAG: site-2 protease family protein [Helicobacter sp.]|nr:site-2 protease family protein [Helicobacter sp.]
MALALLISIIGHEIMHGLVAYKYGDNTAKNAGRLSINPIVHIDLVGSIILPATLLILNAPFLFGWAKPVPVMIHRVINNGGYLAAFGVSIAGVTYNFALALASFMLIMTFNMETFGGIFDFSPTVLKIIIFFLMQLLIYNVVLGIFNLWPIPPLDGSQALTYIGLMFKNDFFAKFFEKIHPMTGTLLIMIILATPLADAFFAPAKFIINWLIP